MQWVVFNLFLAVIAGVGAGAWFLLFSAVRALHLSDAAERIFGVIAAGLAIAVVFFATKYSILLAERLVNRHAR